MDLFICEIKIVFSILYKNSLNSNTGLKLEEFVFTYETPVEELKKDSKIWVNACKMLLKLIFLNGIIYSQIN